MTQEHAVSPRRRRRDRLVGWLLQRRRALADRAEARQAGRGGAFRGELGMTLIEIMVVVAIIGLLLGTVGVVAFNKWKKAQLTNGKQVVKNIEQAIEHYALENSGSTCPKELKDLVPGQIKRVPKDPWGEPLIYKCPGEQNTGGADISSKGPDKKEGTDDDINSWEL